MKTQDLLKIRVTSELNTAINNMKTKEHEKHARKLAKMFGLCYEEALLKASSIVIKAEGIELITDFLEAVADHFLQYSIETFREVDDALLRDSNPSQAHLSSEDLAPTEEYVSMRRKRDSAIFIFAVLLIAINGERTNLFRDLDGIRADIKRSQAFNRKDVNVYH